MAIQDKIEEKLKGLRKKYPSIHSQIEIDEDEKRLRELIVQKDFAQHELVIKIVEDAKARVASVNFLLAFDEDLNLPANEAKRYALFRTREVWQFILDRFGVDQKEIEAIINDIEKSIDVELNKD